MNEIAEKPDILSLLPEELEAALAALGQPRFRAAQIFQWLGRGVRDFDEMTNLSRDLREKLKENFHLYAPKVLSKQVSAIDGTIKYLWELSDGNAVETVVMSSPGLRLLRLHHRGTGAQSARVRDFGRGHFLRA